jgi:hypothetical protein
LWAKGREREKEREREREIGFCNLGLPIEGGWEKRSEVN